MPWHSISQTGQRLTLHTKQCQTYNQLFFNLTKSYPLAILDFILILKVTILKCWSVTGSDKWCMPSNQRSHLLFVSIVFCIMTVWDFSFSSTALNLYYNSGQRPHRPLPWKTWPSWKSSRSNLIFFSFNEQWLSLFLSIYGWWNVFSSMPQCPAWTCSLR